MECVALEMVTALTSNSRKRGRGKWLIGEVTDQEDGCGNLASITGRK